MTGNSCTCSLMIRHEISSTHFSDTTDLQTLPRFRAAGFFFLGVLFLNGLGGSALFGTDMILFTASRNRVNASGPSIISTVRGFIRPSCHGWQVFCEVSHQSTGGVEDVKG